MGAEYFYGFFGPGVSQWHPPLWENTTPMEAPKTPEEGYHLEADMADKTIALIQREKSIHPDKPWIAYYAPNGHKPPVGVPSEWIEKYRGKFDDGYDQLRDRILARQKELGIVPADTKLAPWPEVLPSWDDLTDLDKKVGARWMEVFCGAVEHTDYQVGRIVEAIEQTGELDNTLIIYIAGDNGPTPEGGLHGIMNKLSYFNGVPESLEDVASRMDDFGGPKSHGCYPAAWGYATSTPFTYGKMVTSGGGCSTAVGRFPGRRASRQGGLRRQFHHLIDVAPTILESVGLPEPTRVNGVEQMPMEGVSMLYTFDDAQAEDRHTTQYFELTGSRAIYHEGWWAGTRHGLDGVTDAAKEFVPFDQDVWELYDMRNDFGHANRPRGRAPGEAQGIARHSSTAKPASTTSIRWPTALMSCWPPTGRSSSLATRPATAPAPSGSRRTRSSTSRTDRSPSSPRSKTRTATQRASLVTLGGETGGFAFLVLDGKPTFHLQLARSGAIHDHLLGAAAQGQLHDPLRLRLRRRRRRQGRHGHAVGQRKDGRRGPARENGADLLLDRRHVRCGRGLGHAGVVDVQASIHVHRHPEESDSANREPVNDGRIPPTEVDPSRET